MAKKDKYDMATGAKLRRLELGQWETAEQIFEAMQADRVEHERVADSTPDKWEPVNVKLNTPFEGL